VLNWWLNWWLKSWLELKYSELKYSGGAFQIASKYKHIDVRKWWLKSGSGLNLKN
jgi:hypothetical protein